MEADVGERKRLEEVMQLSLKITGGADVKECRWPLEIWTSKGNRFSLRAFALPAH